MVTKIIDGDDKLKKHSSTNPDVQFKEFSLIKQKLDLEQTMSELGKTFPKKSDQKIKNIAGRLPENSRDRCLWPSMN